MPVFSIFCSVSMACSYHYNPSFYTFHPKSTLPTRFFHPISLAHGITHTHSVEVKANTGRQKLNNITSITRVDGVECQLDHREDLCSGSLGVCDVVVGVLGGGQLGRMLCQAASPLGIKVVILDPAEDCPASKLAYRHVVGSFRDAHAVKEFAKGCGVLTVEIEHVDVETLDVLASEGVDIEPSPRSIRIIQDKYLQKVHFHQCGVPLPDFMKIDNEDDAKRAGHDFGYPMMLKSRLLAYDGRGNAVVRSQDDLMPAVSLLGGFGRGLYAEKWAPFVKELAVMVARGRDGSLRSFPVVETWHKDNVCHMVQAPALISVRSVKAAMETAEKAVASLTGAGIFGVELFLLDDGQVLLNEVAPRPHNSGHYSIEACFVSQFEQHLRAVLGLPLGNSSMKVPAAMMYNLLGEEEGAMGFEIAQNILHQALLVPGASVHWYEKPEIKKHRKIGHITITGASMEAVKEQMSSLVPHKSEEKDAPQRFQESCEKFQLAKVGIIMGSDSDLPVMKDAAVVLDMFDIPYEIKIVSAHRTPLFMVEYAQQASSRGIQVIIAGAGGAAHLPGMVASLTTLPVIGVPVKGSSLDGYDSLLSIVQMPKGVPVATVGVQNATNAGLLAARILGSSNAELQARVSAYQEELKASVSSKNDRLSAVGWKDY